MENTYALHYTGAQVNEAIKRVLENEAGDGSNISLEAGGGENSVQQIGSIANGQHTVALGENSIASATAQTVVGKNNVESTNALFIVGNGKTSTNRENAFEVTNDGAIRLGAASFGTTDLVEGESTLAPGQLYFVYED